jgi:aspartate carbamoyltransferase catalytic subunit
MKTQPSHILSVKQFNRDKLQQLFKLADTMLPYANREKRTTVLNGAILANLFFEPSTRTRTSFACAFNLLGGTVRETVGTEFTALSKGESLADMAKVTSSYSDIIVMRHPQIGSVEAFSTHTSIPVINGGDGANEHPTQALLDIYTMEKELQSQDKGISNSHIVLMGDLKHGRTVHSLIQLLTLYDNVKLTLISPVDLCLPAPYMQLLSNHDITVTNHIAGHIDADIVYQTRIQTERFENHSQAVKQRGLLQLNRHTFRQNFGLNTVIMHPLPRDARPEANELDEDLDNHPRLAIFRQVDNGLLIRMALFVQLLDVSSVITHHDHHVPWKTHR